MKNLYFTGCSYTFEFLTLMIDSPLPLSIVISQVTPMLYAKNHHLVACESRW